MIVNGFICCPRCGTKSKVKVKERTVMRHFPLWCNWCKHETMVNVVNMTVKTIGNEPQNA